MTATILTYLGKVICNSTKLPDGKLEEILDEKKRIQTQSKFFPLEFNQINTIEFYPRKEEWETLEYRNKVVQYLKDEGFLGGEGNFLVQTISLQTA